MKEIIKPGMFGKSVACDKLRTTFDFQNEQLLFSGRQIDVIFFGDSIMEMWNTSLAFEGLGFTVNRGIGGDVTEYLLKRADADVFQLNPKSIVFLAGINDILTCAPNLWWKTEGADKESVIRNANRNICEIMRKCKERGIKGYFCSVLPTDFCVPYNGFGLEKVILSLNDKIQKSCLEYGMTYVDCYTKLCKDDGLHIKDGYTYDGVHPNPVCYEIMANLLRGYLANEI